MATSDLARLERALERQDDTVVGPTDKGLPNDQPLRFGDVGRQRWNLLAGDLPLPALVMKRSAVDHNIALLQSYCDTHGVWLAPHGKTTMAPQLFLEQLRAGAWAMTVANIAQLRVCRVFGIPRVLIANEVVGAFELDYIARELRDDADHEIYVFADSPIAVERMAEELAGAGRPLHVLVELGFEGGRCGARDVGTLLDVADAVLRAEPALTLAGVAGYEGIVTGGSMDERIGAADRYLAGLADAARTVRARVREDRRLLVSAGGSMYFDRVVAALGRDALPEAQLVVRPGCYVTHDSEFFDVSSPMGSRCDRLGVGTLRPALELWASVLSREEPELAIVGAGRRDFPSDVGLPVALWVADGEPRPLSGCEVVAANDQHAYLRVPAETALAAGDVVGMGIQHPCAAFDRWRTMLVVDDGYGVIGAVRTYF